MYFDSIRAMLQMDGHGAYVWSAYLIALLVIAAMVVVPIRRRRSFLMQLKGEVKRQQAAKQNFKEDA